MTMQDLITEIKGLKGYVDSRIADVGKLPKEEMDRIIAKQTALEGRLVELQRDVQRTVTREGKIVLQSGKLVGMDLLDLKILERVLKFRESESGGPHPLIGDVREGRKALMSMMSVRSLMDWEEGAVDRRLRWLSGVDSRSGSAQNFKDAVRGWTRQLLYDRRALDSVTAGAGDELVPTFEAAELWMDVNLDTLVLPLIPQQAMPTNPFDIPRQFGDTNWYPVDENTQVTTTDPSTGKATLTAYTLKTGVPFSDELEEDAIIALVPEIRSGLARNAAQVIDDVLLNADTTAANNINLDQTTISKAYPSYAQFLLGFDGIRHLPLVDNTNLRTSKGAAADAAMLYLILGKLEKYGVARRPGEVVFISDPRSTAAVMSATSLTSVNSFGERATLSVGELRQVIGIPWIRSDQMRVSSTTGLVSSTTANNTTGNVLLVNTSQWRVGFRRQISMETAREAGKGQTTMYVSFRIALTERTGTRSTAKHTGLVYGITGV